MTADPSRHARPFAQVYRDWTMPFPDEPSRLVWCWAVLDQHPLERDNFSVRGTGEAQSWREAMDAALTRVDEVRAQPVRTYLGTPEEVRRSPIGRPPRN